MYKIIVRMHGEYEREIILDSEKEMLESVKLYMSMEYLIEIKVMKNESD